jgi:HlyD family secretion protein
MTLPGQPEGLRYEADRASRGFARSAEPSGLPACGPLTSMRLFSTSHRRPPAHRPFCFAFAPLAAALVAASFACRPAGAQAPASVTEVDSRRNTAALSRRDFVHSRRITGTTEAVRSSTISTPRLTGQPAGSLVITRLAPAGTTVEPGDLLVEFDRQDQLRNAMTRRAELRDLEEQIRKKRAEQQAARVRDETGLQQAASDVARARLEMLKNEMLPPIEAEKNEQRLEEAEARLAQLRTTFDLKRKAAEAEIRILEIRRDRAESAMRHAEQNAERMAIASPLAGLVVLKSVWKMGTMGEVQEGEEVRSGTPVLDVVDPSAMQVRARVNQADVTALAPGQPARIQLDAYPDVAFEGRVEQIAPIALTSGFSPRVRTFVALISIAGTDPRLMPDLTAAIDIEIERAPGVLVAPRDAVGFGESGPFVRVAAGSRFEERRVTLGPRSAHEVVIVSGVPEGAVIMRSVLR